MIVCINKISNQFENVYTDYKIHYVIQYIYSLD